MDLTMTVYVLAAFTIAGTIFLPVLAIVITMMRAGAPPDAKDSDGSGGRDDRGER